MAAGLIHPMPTAPFVRMGRRDRGHSVEKSAGSPVQNTIAWLPEPGVTLT